jgi:adenosylhomocysteine nucleosidase
MADRERKTTTDEPPLIALIVATRIEAQPLIDLLGLAEDRGVPCPLFRGGRIMLVVSGVGKTNAAIATTWCCTAFHPSLIVNLGAAGATGAHCALGGIFHITTVCEPDRPRFPSSEPYLHRPQTVPGFTEATLATRDRPAIERADREEISVHADLVDMEAAAVVQTARRFETPCLLFKFVSDTSDDVDPSAAIAFMKNYGPVFGRFIVEKVMPLLVPWSVTRASPQ